MHSMTFNEKREKSMIANNNLSNLSPTVIESQIERHGVGNNKTSNKRLKLRSATQVEKNVKFNLDDEDCEKSGFGNNNMNVISSDIKLTYIDTPIKEKDDKENKEDDLKENNHQSKTSQGKLKRKATTACKCLVF